MLKNIVKAGMVVMMLALAIPASSEAAKAPKLSSKKVTLTVGKSKTITVKNTTKKVKWKNSAKSVVKVKKVSSRKVKITAKKKGTAKVTATVGGKKLTCKVTVKAKSTSATTTTASSKGTGSSTSSESVNDSVSDSSGTSITINTTTGDTGTTGSTSDVDLSDGFFDPFTNTVLEDGDTLSTYIRGTEDLTDGSLEDGTSANIALCCDIEDISFTLENNTTEDGNPIFVVSLINGDIHGGNDYVYLNIVSIREGSADLTVNAAGETMTFHLESEGVYNTFMNYNDVLLAMMETPLGETAEVTLEGDCAPTTTVTIDGVDTVYTNEKTITVDGVKGANDVETLLNLGAWIVDNKSYRYGSEDDMDDVSHSTYFFFREWWAGSDCGGLNTITEDAACLLGYTAWQYNSSGHLITMAVIDGQVYNFDSGGSGSAGVRGFSGGCTTYDPDNNYAGPAVTYNYMGTQPDRYWKVTYYNRTSSNTLTSVATETVTALSDLTRPLPWYGD